MDISIKIQSKGTACICLTDWLLLFCFKLSVLVYIIFTGAGKCV